MKIIEIISLQREGSNATNWKFIAKVSVQTGFLWWKKTEVREVARKYADVWFFTDSGEFAPLVQMDTLARPLFFKMGW